MFRGGEIPNGAYHREDLLARTTSYKSIKISRERCIQGILVSCPWNRDAFIKRYFFLKSFKIYLYEINFEHYNYFLSSILILFLLFIYT